ncbi:sigma-70 family RNA polymerase sigma factor [Flavobacteriaceae bacterium F08102]|nr:sigma-70 family RNA polymerase sigma factor [Flavobacteriaceae bacterium F08102]
MKYEFKNNEKFIKHLSKGREDAYVYLVETYHRPLFVYALSLNGDPRMAEDLVQIVFYKIWEKRKKLDETYALKPYLYKILYNEFINEYHRGRSISPLEGTFKEAIDEILEENSHELLERKIALVMEGVKHLPPKCKETFLLSKKEGLTNIEIAEYLNISTKTVEGQLTKAYHIIRKQVGSKIKSLFILVLGKRNSQKIASTKCTSASR